jgi:fatty acid desaturase
MRTHTGHSLGVPTRVIDRRAISEMVRAHSQVSGWRTALAIAREWGLVATTVALALASDHPLIWVVAGAFIATRQHALLILMHDAAHHRLVQNRVLNDILGDMLLALPNNVLLRRYRIRHAAHHRFANDRTRDPDRATIEADDQWQFPRTRLSAVTVFLRDLAGLNAGRTARVVAFYAPWPVLFSRLTRGGRGAGPGDAPATNAELARVAVYLVALAAGLFLTGGWWVYLALWIAPSLTVLPALLRLRGISEHEGAVGTNEVSVSRHVHAGPTEAFLISPFHINDHVTHHLFPSVPWYNLPALHARLLQVPEYRDNLVTAPSYTGAGGVVDILMPQSPQTKAALAS